MTTRLSRLLRLGAYLLIARWLPEGPMPLGKPSRRFRSWLVSPLLAQADPIIYVERDARFGDGSLIRLGNRSNLGVNSRIQGPVHIGEDVMMGPDVMIFTTGHGSDDPYTPMWGQKWPARRLVTIGDDVWIGARSIILPGVTIGSHVIIGAGAVVSKDVPDWGVAVGNPARVVRDRRITRGVVAPDASAGDS